MTHISKTKLCRSQEEYENLSPCKGSINMGLATNIMPGLAAVGVFQIITRTNTVTLVSYKLI